MRIECGIGLRSGTGPVLQRGTIPVAYVPFLDRRLARLAARTASGPLTAGSRDGWWRALGEALAPLVDGHRLVTGRSHPGGPEEGWVMTVFRTAGGEVRAWGLHGARPGPALSHDDAWDDFRAAAGEGRFFLAHDLLEPAWRSSRAPRMQIAIFVAAAFYHRSRHNLLGAGKLFCKAEAEVVRDPKADGRLVAALQALARDPERAEPLTAEGLDLLIQWGRRPCASHPSARAGECACGSGGEK